MAWYKDIISNKIGLVEYNARVEAGNITPTMIEQQVWVNNLLTMQDQENCHNLKPVAMSGSYNDLVDRPEIKNVVVNNSLTSDSATQALAAAQGKVLDEKIKNVDGKIPVLGTKKYLHRIEMSIVSQDRTKSAQLYLDYYSDIAEPFTDCVFTTMSSYAQRIPVTGNMFMINSGNPTQTYAFTLSILSFNGQYAFIMNGNAVEIDTYDGYKNDWTIKDIVVGYLFA